MTPNVNYGLWVLMMSHCRVVDGDRYTQCGLLMLWKALGTVGAWEDRGNLFTISFVVNLEWL